MLASMLRVYMHGDERRLMIDGMAVNPQNCANWDAAFVADIFARLCVDYELTHREVRRARPEMERLTTGVREQAQGKEIAERKLRDAERTIENLRRARSGGLTEDEAQDLRAQIAAANTANAALQAKLKEFTVPQQGAMVLYCKEANAFLNINRDKKTVTFTNAITGAGGVSIIPSFDLMKSAMAMVAQWTAAEVTTNKNMPQREKGVTEFTLVPMSMAFRAGRGYVVTQKGDNLTMRPVEEVVQVPVKIADPAPASDAPAQAPAAQAVSAPATVVEHEDDMLTPAVNPRRLAIALAARGEVEDDAVTAAPSPAMPTIASGELDMDEEIVRYAPTGKVSASIPVVEDDMETEVSPRRSSSSFSGRKFTSSNAGNSGGRRRR
jgi:hypothetical protein